MSVPNCIEQWVAAFCRAYWAPACERCAFPVKAAGLAATAALEPSRDVMAAAFAIATACLLSVLLALLSAACAITGSSLSAS